MASERILEWLLGWVILLGRSLPDSPGENNHIYHNHEWRIHIKTSNSVPPQ